MRTGKLGRTSSHRKALFRSLAVAVILHERVETTHTKAKAVQPFIEEMITLGKRGDLSARRQAASFLQNPKAVGLLFDEIAPRFADRQGGYTRIVKTSRRRGDAAELAIIEFVEA
ncbi:MAG: 50S ribosomal protein L17 [Limnochordia bacterium]|nr:50S ribosomal protein L17 [Limnochordia bacterium]MDD2630013.1 50S ribosomal protein L17 [Limnochordia bacterium]MDD4517481.1 50S ribosomal protein L17 [Limnochordia bacterium]